jgi:hypothetical protein
MPLSFSFEGYTFLKTAAFVPFLFAFAGVAMSSIVLFLDSLHFESLPEKVSKSSKQLARWPKVFYGISAFSAQYWLSGYLDASGVDPLQINLILSALAIAGFVYFDSSYAGLLLAIVTAISGPVAEIILVKLGAYDYTHNDVFGIDSWIPSVYFLGGPAVGNLARAIQYEFISREPQQEKN